MCNEDGRLKFCQCPEDVNSLKYSGTKYSYQWSLFRFVNTTLEIGRIVMPSEDIGNGYTISKLLDDLNSGNCFFDFSYTPTDGDKIFIHKLENNTNHLCAEFSNGLWEKSKSSFDEYNKLASGFLDKA